MQATQTNASSKALAKHPSRSDGSGSAGRPQRCSSSCCRTGGTRRAAAEAEAAAPAPASSTRRLRWAGRVARVATFGLRFKPGLLSSRAGHAHSLNPLPHPLTSRASPRMMAARQAHAHSDQAGSARPLTPLQHAPQEGRLHVCVGREGSAQHGPAHRRQGSAVTATGGCWLQAPRAAHLPRVQGSQ